MQIKGKTIKNILVFRNDRFGEFLLNIPAFRALKETFKDARLIAVVDYSVKELAKRVGFIDEIIEWNQGKHPLSEKARFINLLRKKQIDIAVILNPARDFNIFTYLAGIPIRVGYNRKWGFLLTHKMEDEKYLGQRHEIEYNLELAALIGAGTQDETLCLSIDDREINDLFRDFNIKDCNNLIALHPWTSDPIKQWPLDNFFELAKRLVREQDIKVIIIGGKDELTKSIEFFPPQNVADSPRITNRNIDGNLINLTGRTTLTQLAALLKKCKLLISGDSGPVHLACTVGTKALAIFRNDIPGKSAHRWGPWGRGHIVIEKENLSDITVDDVFGKVKEVLINK
ncbi:MAG: glycosyltransferase family 9 protein [Candidatus Omnitrophota bacterium]|nr:glycosyltransferase family 9 protein [Candidatus Omnitrophota bacterium]